MKDGTLRWIFRYRNLYFGSIKNWYILKKIHLNKVYEFQSVTMASVADENSNSLEKGGEGRESTTVSFILK